MKFQEIECEPENCQRCNRVMNNAAGGYCYECSADDYNEDK